MDCVQVESAATASRFNLVQNGDFRISSGWSSASDTAAYAVPKDEKGNALPSAAPQMNNTGCEMVGDPTKQSRIYQMLTISGDAGDNFVLAGWAKGDSAPLPEAEDGEDQRQFALIGTFIYADGSDSEEFIAQFNPDTNEAESWQYVAEVMVAAKAYTGVKIEVAYDYNVNTVYFDGIQLFKEQFGSSYTYNEDGDVTSVVDLQNKTTTYEYDEDGNLTKIIQDNKAKMTYEYDDWHNVVKATSEKGVVYEFEYDTWGNNTAVWIADGNSKIKTSATYTDDKNHLSTTTDAVGNITSYNYDTNTSVLVWVKYPEDTSSTNTVYYYDSMYRLHLAISTVNTGGLLSVDYTYNDSDLLSALETVSTTYTFDYGAFGLRSDVKIGGHTLANYSYTSDRNNYLDTLAYGNGDSVQYTYDDHGRVTKHTYDNGDTVTYQYDNNGALATVTDSATGIKTTYYYDFTDRLMKYVESGSGYSHSVGYEYDNINNLTKLVEIINGVEHSTAYTYDEDNRVTAVTNGNATKEYSYDGFGRIDTLTTKNGTSTVKTDSFAFKPHNSESTQTTGQIGAHTITYGDTTKQYSYTYDANGNIATISDGTYTTSYIYDTANQLVREDNQAGGYIHTWEYDDAGNILCRKEYAYTTSTTLGTPSKTVNYAYDTTSGWGDRLISYDGKTISYETTDSGYISGNIVSDGTWNYTWEHGRQLESMSNGSTTWSFTYNADGLRTERDNGTTTYQYVYNGGSLSQMTVGANTLYFAYDAAGTPMSVTYNSTTYYYVTNIQGDVIAILDSNGTAVVTYTYDAWGNLLNVSGTMASSLGLDNPLRYRGYIWDSETELYYLQTRYYSSKLGRFLSSDVFAATGSGFAGNNMFVYCNNNPVMGYDPTGCLDFGGLLTGVALIAAGAAALCLTTVTAGLASPLLAVVATSVVTAIGVATVETGSAITGAAIDDGVAVIDVSVTNGHTGDKTGMSAVVDYGNDTVEVYSHYGHSNASSYSITYGAGQVYNYDDLGQYAGDFVDVSASTTHKGIDYGIDVCTDPGPGDASAMLFTVGYSSPSVRGGGGSVVVSMDHYFPVFHYRF